MGGGSPGAVRRLRHSHEIRGFLSLGSPFLSEILFIGYAQTDMKNSGKDAASVGLDRAQRIRMYVSSFVSLS